MERDSLATLPNLMSLSRLGLAAAFAYLRGSDERLLIIAAAGATDFLDGYLARTRGGVTRWGALIDSIADRFFIFVAVCALLFDGIVGTWQYVILISRDFMTAVGFLTARAVPRLRAVTFRSRMPGKVVTVIQLATLALIFVRPEWVGAAFAVLAVASAYAILDYTMALWRARARS